jgi:LPS-assembly lipoprotein
LLAICALGALLGGCFQPMYAENTVTGAPGLRDKLSGVDLPVVKTNPTDARLGVSLKNALAFSMYGSVTGSSPTHRLEIRLSSSRASIIVDVNTARPDIENYGIDASYVLREIATNRAVMQGSAFARVSYDIPGQEQRFARARGFRDAEDRATQEISDKISQRLASYFVAGT